VIRDIAAAVGIQSRAVVSKVVHRDEGGHVAVFGFDAAQELTEHEAAGATVVQVISGRLRVTADGRRSTADPAFASKHGAGLARARSWRPSPRSCCSQCCGPGSGGARS
jgi:hypothetical protein